MMRYHKISIDYGCLQSGLIGEGYRTASGSIDSFSNWCDVATLGCLVRFRSRPALPETNRID